MPRQKATPVTIPLDRSSRATPATRLRRSPHPVPLAVILAAVLVANAPALLHLVTTNPLVLNAALTPTPTGWLPGLPYIDGNAGFTMQALGHLAALDWLHGHVPWWNPFEGVGAPLAGEMQSGAFFPLTLLLALHDGVLWVQLAVEAVAGWSTYFLVRRLGVARPFATAAGVAFGLCGTLAWLAHAPIRPVALLPLCLIGVERSVDAAREHRRGGWRVLAVALALSILAGFPETTFIDALFVAWWSVLRLAGPGRPVWRAALARLAGGVAVGVALAAPLLAAFADYLPHAYIGAHNGGFADTSLPSVGLAQLVLPYSLGPIFGFFSPAGTPDPIANLWGSVGGFLSITVIAAGLVGLVGRRQRLLRIGLGGWIAVCLLRTFGFPPVVHLMAVIPGVRLTAFFRYADPSWELAAVVLAAMGIDDIARRSTRPRVLVVSVTATGLMATWAALTTWPVLSGALTSSGQTEHRHAYPVGSLIGAGIALTLLAVGGLIAGRRRGSRRWRTGPSVGTDRASGTAAHGWRHVRRIGAAAGSDLPVGPSTDLAADRFGPLAAGPPGRRPFRHPRADLTELRVLLRRRRGQHQRPPGPQSLEHLYRDPPGPQRTSRRLLGRGTNQSRRPDPGTGVEQERLQLRVGRCALRGRELQRTRCPGTAVSGSGHAAVACGPSARPP